MRCPGSANPDQLLTPSTPADLQRLHAAYASGVYCFLLTLTHDAGVAEDLLQEVFVKLARDVSGLKQSDSEAAWIFKMARNGALDWRRRCQVRQNTANQFVDLSSAFVAPDDPDAAAIQRRLTQQLAALPEEQSAVVHLHLWEGMTFREISVIQEVALPTVTSRYRYGIQTLRTALQPLYNELYDASH